MPTGLDRFIEALGTHFHPDNRASNASALKRYFGLLGNPAFDGAKFESYGIGSSDPNRIDGNDLVAVSLLSMEIRRKSLSGITTANALRLEELADDISMLLQAIPLDRDLHELNSTEYEDLVGEHSVGDRLWRVLRDDVGMHRVASFKLIARKRPRLYPIADSRTEAALGRQENWWHTWHQALTTQRDVVDELRSIRDDVAEIHAVVRGVSLLRVADIAIWNHAEGLPTE